jgi:hypothetical protein
MNSARAARCEVLHIANFCAAIDPRLFTGLHRYAIFQELVATPPDAGAKCGRDMAKDSGAVGTGDDPDYRSGGSDSLMYRVPLAALKGNARPASVLATLYYQAPPPFFLQDRFLHSEKHRHPAPVLPCQQSRARRYSGARLEAEGRKQRAGGCAVGALVARPTRRGNQQTTVRPDAAMRSGLSSGMQYSQKHRLGAKSELR